MKTYSELNSQIILIYIYILTHSENNTSIKYNTCLNKGVDARL